jgi:hypothetical protein
MRFGFHTKFLSAIDEVVGDLETITPGGQPILIEWMLKKK